AKGDDKFITTDYLQQCRFCSQYSISKIPSDINQHL
ncbi:large terminase, partial [Klebsiella pneumoniae]|nr:large terminase [Klebsiella pneumoniae]